MNYILEQCKNIVHYKMREHDMDFNDRLHTSFVLKNHNHGDSITFIFNCMTVVRVILSMTVRN